MFRIVLICIAFTFVKSQATFGVATLPSGPSDIDLPYGVYTNETSSPVRHDNQTLELNITTTVLPVNETTKLVTTTTTTTTAELHHNATTVTTTPTNIMKITTSSMNEQNVTTQMANTTTIPTTPKSSSSAVTSISFGFLVYFSLLAVATFR